MGRKTGIATISHSFCMFSYYVGYVGYTFKVITHNGHAFEMNLTVEILV